MRRPVIWLAAAGGVLALLLVVAVILRRSGPAAESDLRLLGDPLQVAILSPRPGSAATVGLPVAIEVTAFGENPLTAVELWADGELVEAFYPSGETLPTHWPMSFVWIPHSEGTHLLVARAIDDRQGSAESNTLALMAANRTLIEEVKVGPAEEEGAFAIGGGGAGPAGDPGPANPLPQPAPNPDDDRGAPASEFQPSWLPSWLASAFEQDPPAAPELTGETDGCTLNLAIHDLSDNEDGFRLYRKVPGDKKWQTIATLAGQAEAEYVTYAFDGASAPSWYRAEAFNSLGQAASLPLWLDLSGEGCNPAEPAEPVMEVKLVGLSSEVAADKAYCYASIGGLLWQRLPAFGFFPSMPGGFEIDQVVAEITDVALGGPDTSPQPLDLECWGWAGGTLEALGEIHLDSFPGSEPTFEISGDVLSAILEQAPVYHTLGGDADFPSPDDFAIGGDPNLPYTFALVTDNVENCKSHTPSGGTSLVEALLFCTPYPEFPDGSQPYLTWWLIEGACPAGKGEDCYSLDDLQQVIDEQGGKFGYTVYDCDTTGLCYVHTFPLELTAFVIPPFTACGEPRYFVAQFNVYVGPSDYPTLSGPGSPPFAYSIPCPEAYESEGFVELDVSFDSLTIGNADDDDGGNEDLEVYGYFEARTSSGDDSRLLNVGSWGYSSSDCPFSEAFSGSLSTAGANSMPECPSQVENGTVPLSDFMLCQSDYTDSCYLWPEDVGTDYGLNNNHFQLRVLEGNAVIVEVLLIDYDDGSANDTACHIVFSTPNWPLETWSGMIGAQFSGGQGDNGNASCSVSVTFTAVGP